MPSVDVVGKTEMQRQLFSPFGPNPDLHSQTFLFPRQFSNTFQIILQTFLRQDPLEETNSGQANGRLTAGSSPLADFPAVFPDLIFVMKQIQIQISRS